MMDIANDKPETLLKDFTVPETENSIDCEDEDVILPNSPLFEYFEETERDRGTVISENIESKGTIKKLNISPFLKEIFKPLFTFYETFCDIYTTNCRKIQTEIFSGVLQSANSNRLLISDDFRFLKSFEPNVTLQKYSKVYIRSFLALSLILAFITYATFVQFDVNFIQIDCCILKMLTRRIGLLLVGFLFSSFVYLGVLILYHRWLGFVLLKKINKLCIESKRIMQVFKRIYRSIQESEMGARGLLLSSNLGIVNRLELSPSLPIKMPCRQLPELRKSLFVWTHKLFFHHRKITSQLITIVPLPAECLSQYCAMIPLEEFGNLFKFDPNSVNDSQEFLEASDGCSLSSLKIIQHLLTIQISEFYKRLILSFSPEFSVSKSYFTLFDNMNGFLRLLDETIDLCLDIKFDAQHADLLNRNMDNVVSKVPELNRPIRNTPICVFTSDLHNLSIHLRNALKKVIAVEDDFAKILENQDFTLTQEFVSELEKTLLELKSEIDTASDINSICLNSTKEHLPNTNVEKVPQSISLDGFSTISKEKNPTSVIIDSDRLIEDEVLEGQGTEQENEFKSQDISEMDDIDQNSQHLTNKMMLELKKILVIKAEEHQLREEKALRAKRSMLVESDNDLLDRIPDPSLACSRVKEPEAQQNVMELLQQENLTKTTGKEYIEGRENKAIRNNSQHSLERELNENDLLNSEIKSIFSCASVIEEALQRRVQFQLANEDFEFLGETSSDDEDTDNL